MRVSGVTSTKRVGQVFLARRPPPSEAKWRRMSKISHNVPCTEEGGQNTPFPFPQKKPGSRCRAKKRCDEYAEQTKMMCIWTEAMEKVGKSYFLSATQVVSPACTSIVVSFVSGDRFDPSIVKGRRRKKKGILYPTYPPKKAEFLVP